MQETGYVNAQTRGFVGTASQLGTNGARPDTPPVVDRLLGLRSRLLSMSAHLIAFEQRMNGSPPEPANNKISGDPNYPPSSIEDLLSQIETVVTDIDAGHNRLASRF